MLTNIYSNTLHTSLVNASSSDKLKYIINTFGLSILPTIRDRCKKYKDELKQKVDAYNKKRVQILAVIDHLTNQYVVNGGNTSNNSDTGILDSQIADINTIITNIKRNIDTVDERMQQISNHISNISAKNDIYKMLDFSKMDSNTNMNVENDNTKDIIKNIGGLDAARKNALRLKWLIESLNIDVNDAEHKYADNEIYLDDNKCNELLNSVNAINKQVSYINDTIDSITKYIPVVNSLIKEYNIDNDCIDGCQQCVSSNMICSYHLKEIQCIYDLCKGDCENDVKSVINNTLLDVFNIRGMSKSDILQNSEILDNIVTNILHIVAGNSQYIAKIKTAIGNSSHVNNSVVKSCHLVIQKRDKLIETMNCVVNSKKILHSMLTNMLNNMNRLLSRNDEIDMYSKYLEYTQNIRKIDELRAELSDLMTEKRKQNELLMHRMVELNNLVSQKNQYANNLDVIEDKKGALKEVDSNIDDVCKKVSICDLYDEIFDIKGVYVHRYLQSRLNLINKHMNRILQEYVKYSVDFTLNGKGLEYIISHESANISVNHLSGFEQFMFDISLKISTNLFGACRRSKFFAIDEGLDVIDKNNIEKLKDLFSAIKGVYDTVVIITHRDGIDQYCDTTIDI